MQSMTGYGRSLRCEDGRELLMELKTVNHRFLDITFRLPRALLFLEDRLRKLIQASGIGRGHVDVFVTYQNVREDAKTVQMDWPLFRACVAAVEKANGEPPFPGMANVAEIITLCGAMTVTQTEEDVEAVTRLGEEAFAQAAEELLMMRRQEGEALRLDLIANLSQLRTLTEGIAKRAPTVPEHYRERLMGRLKEWNAEAEPQRVAQEVALLADRAAIDEELSRLGSHMAQFEQCVAGSGEIGRKLDFLLQEMNREANTIGSKASDAEIARQVVDAKCVIEKLREQAQNVV